MPAATKKKISREGAATERPMSPLLRKKCMTRADTRRTAYIMDPNEYAG
jgi:hypothetical protein